MKLLKITLSIFLLTLLTQSCGDDPQGEDPETPTANAGNTPSDSKREIFNPVHLAGKWILTHATIDRIPTPRLDSVYFEFTDENILKTNILGTDEAGTYSLKNKKMTQTTAKTIEYNIQKLVSDSLVMSMEVGKKKFRVTLQK